MNWKTDHETIASRHIKNFHQKYELPESRVRKACNACRTRKERCDGKSPCSSCERRGIYCSLSPDSAAQTMIQTNTLTPAAVIMDTKDAETSITGPVIQKYIDIYFRDFHPHWPFLHPSTFDASREPFILVQSVVMIGMWITGHLAKRDAALELHRRLSDAVRVQAVNRQNLFYPLGTDLVANTEVITTGILVYSYIRLAAKYSCSMAHGDLPEYTSPDHHGIVSRERKQQHRYKSTAPTQCRRLVHPGDSGPHLPSIRHVSLSEDD